MSDSYFSIVSDGVILTSMTGGEYLLGGNDYEITWVDNLVEDVRIDLFQNDVYFSNITLSDPGNGFYLWSVPNYLNGSNFKIKIASAIMPEIHNDISSERISIFSSFIEEVSPSENISLLPESQYEINWIDNIDDDVKIELCDEAGNPVFTLAESVNSTGSYVCEYLMLPDQNNYKFKVSSVSNPELFAYSSGAVKLIPYYISNVTPAQNIELKPLSFNPSQNQRVEIMWNDNLDGEINIDLVDENGISVFPIYYGTGQSPGYFLWENAEIPYEPDFPNREYRIKVWKETNTWSGTELIQSISKGTIKNKKLYISNVMPAQNIELKPLSFNPSQNQRVEIMWNDNLDGEMNIDLVDENGMSVFSIYYGTGQSPGYFLWEYAEIPFDPFYPNREYRIKVWKEINTWSGFELINSTGLGSLKYSTPVINSVSPINTDYIFPGDRYHITWNDNIYENVRIELFEGGVFHSEIALDTQSTGSYIWNCPEELTGYDFQFKVTAIDDYGTGIEISCLSTGKLMIIKGPVVMVSPGGGELLSEGEKFEIKWYDEIEEDVTLQLYQNGSFLSEIVSSVPSTGSYLWDLPSGLSGEFFQVRIVSIASPEINDISRGYFQIAADAPASPTNISTSVISGILQIDWDDVPNANSYILYSSNDPYGEFLFDTIVTQSYWSGEIGSEDKKFFYIVSSSEIIKSADPVNLVKEKIKIKKIEDMPR
jgi:hypothetical protein